MHILKELRKERNLLQKDVAEKIGVDRTSYAKYEAGTVEPSSESLKRLADLFGVSVDYLLGRNATDNDLKIALFGGNGEVTDEMLEEVKRYAKFVLQKKDRTKK